MAEYRQRTDCNGNEYRNVILQWENGFSNNDKEVLTIVSCYYEQDWETDMSPLACWVALKSVSFSTRERGPYSCGGCMSRKVCDGHPDGNGGTYHHSDDSADCDNSHTESYCPGDHYDLYVTARLPGCENWNGESGATEQTVAQWEGVSLVFAHGSRAAHGHRHGANSCQVPGGRWEAPQSRFPCREAQPVHTRRNGRTGALRGQSWRTKRKPPCWNTAAKNRDAAGKHSKSHFQFQDTT